MHLEIPISQSQFGWTSTEKRAKADGFDLAQVIEQACSYYVSELDRGRLATELPRFDAESADGTTRPVSLELDDRCAERLDREAERQGASRERLVRHATLLYLADLEAGRVAGRIAQQAGEPETQAIPLTGPDPG
jgi:hypothetical protein